MGTRGLSLLILKKAEMRTCKELPIMYSVQHWANEWQTRHFKLNVFNLSRWDIHGLFNLKLQIQLAHGKLLLQIGSLRNRNLLHDQWEDAISVLFWNRTKIEWSMYLYNINILRKHNGHLIERSNKGITRQHYTRWLCNPRDHGNDW